MKINDTMSMDMCSIYVLIVDNLQFVSVALVKVYVMNIHWLI